MNYGSDKISINTFYGIRYAAPPTGSLRWKAPVTIDSDNGYNPQQVLDASSPGPQCMQGSRTTEIELAQALSSVPGVAFALGVDSAQGIARANSEDCLLLDVIVPAKPKSYSLPVVIQIHGGGPLLVLLSLFPVILYLNTHTTAIGFNSGNTQTTDGSQFVSYTDGNVIWVAIQYRLGAYGFLGAEEVLADGDPNIGLLDQLAAFKWVQRHIAVFGGNPDKVTIWGTSAGGSSVINQLIINAGAPDPPYRAAIAGKLTYAYLRW